MKLDRRISRQTQEKTIAINDGEFIIIGMNENLDNQLKGSGFYLNLTFGSEGFFEFEQIIINYIDFYNQIMDNPDVKILRRLNDFDIEKFYTLA